MSCKNDIVSILNIVSHRFSLYVKEENESERKRICCCVKNILQTLKLHEMNGIVYDSILIERVKTNTALINNYKKLKIEQSINE